jgi:hypothetical protein
MTSLEKKLKERLGSNGLLDQSMKELRSLLDEKGVKGYLSMVDLFLPFDSSFSMWLLRSGVSTLSSMGDHQTRQDSLEVLLGMGKPKWSVARAGLKKMSVISHMEPGFTLQWLRHGDALGNIDLDTAIFYFEASPSVLELLGSAKFDKWASLGEEIAKLSKKAAREYFKSSPEAIKKIELSDLEQWARLGMHLIEKSPHIKADYGAHSLLAQGASAGKAKRLDLATQYFKSAPHILGRLSMHDLGEWVEKGLKVTDNQKAQGNAFFSLQTGKSIKAVDGLVKGLELKEIHTVLRSYAEALTGTRVLLRSSALFYKNLPGLGRFFSVTDGVRIFLPSKIAVFEDQDLNFKTYKLALAHELAHIQFGTFAVGRPDLKKLSQFRDPVQAFKIFEFLEDERVDHLMGSQYPGLKKDQLGILQRYYHESNNGGERMSVFESLSIHSSQKNHESGAGLIDDPLTGLLRDALSKVKEPERSAHEVLDLTEQICAALEKNSGAAVREGHETPDRVFYRGILDFELVDNTRSDLSRLVLDMVERLQDKRMEITAELVEEAINRIEESEGVESEVVLWQMDDTEKMEELFEHVQQTLADMESEKYLRRSVYYDEWDNNLDDYKKEWCRVREMDMPEASPAVFYKRSIDENYGMVSLLRRYFGLLRPDRIQRFFREDRGDDIDFDALVESVVERYAGVTPSDRVYIRREKNLRDVSVAFLVDMSYSTGDVLPSGKTIIDVEKEGLVLMAEALESLGDQF